MDCKALGLSQKPLQQRLAAVNQLLNEHHLRQLPQLGDNSKGWAEIQDIVGWSGDPTAPFYDIVFLVRRPNGREYTHTIRFNKNGRLSDGVLFIPEINGLVALTKQYRIAIGAETWELARGFPEERDCSAQFHIPSIPPGLARELGEEVMRDAEIQSVVPLGAIAENTGTHNSWIETYIVRIRADEAGLSANLGGTQGLGVKFVTWQELFNPTSLGVRDLHSLALIALAISQTQTSLANI